MNVNDTLSPKIPSNYNRNGRTFKSLNKLNQERRAAIEELKRDKDKHLMNASVLGRTFDGIQDAAATPDDIPDYEEDHSMDKNTPD